MWQIKPFSVEKIKVLDICILVAPAEFSLKEIK